MSGCHPEELNVVWAEVRRDDVAVQFHKEPNDGTPGPSTMFPASVAALAEELKDTIPFARGPEVMDCGMRELGIQDPNGYYLTFAEPA